MSKTISFTAIVETTSEKTFTNETSGSLFVYQRAKITDGPLKDKVVLATRVTMNTKGEIKSPLAVNSNALVYVNRVPSKEDPSKFVYFYTLGAPQDELASNEDVEDAIGDLFE